MTRSGKPPNKIFNFSNLKNPSKVLTTVTTKITNNYNNKNQSYLHKTTKDISLQPNRLNIDNVNIIALDRAAAGFATIRLIVCFG